jgi:hypothetical protein
VSPHVVPHLAKGDGHVVVLQVDPDQNFTGLTTQAEPVQTFTGFFAQADPVHTLM